MFLNIKKSTWNVCLLIFAIIHVLLFWPANLYFLNDDLLHIPLTDYGYLFQTNSVRPLHELLIRLELKVWGKQAAGYHLSAILFQCIVCIQLYFLCLLVQTKWLKLNKEQARAAALLSEILFLIYPQSAESSAWIIGRAPMLSAIFMLVTIHLFFRGLSNWFLIVLGALSFAASLFTYEQTVLLPAALLLVTGLEIGQARKKQLRYIAILFAIVLLYLISRKLVTSEVVGIYEGGNFLHLNWLTLATNFLRLIFRLVLNPADKWVFGVSCATLVLLLVLLAKHVWKLPVNKKAALFFGGITVLLIIPVVSLGLAVNSFESGRYLYLPSIFLTLAISISAVHLYRNYPACRVWLVTLLIITSFYWLFGKWTASRNYRDASRYSKTVHQNIQHHFLQSSDTLYIDTLRITVHRLPVFRLGFKTGIKWLNDNVDTNKVVVKNRYDEVLHRSLQ